MMIVFASLGLLAVLEVGDPAPPARAIAILLDCSGSTGPEESSKDYNRLTPCKYHEATAGLQRALRELPAGVPLSVAVFSHRGQVEAPPKNAEQMEGLIAWVRPPQPWGKDQLAGLMDRVEPLQPWNLSPTVRALLRAKMEGFPKDFRGHKSIIVVADGGDNLFPMDVQLQAIHQTKEVPVLLGKVFQDFGAAIHVIGYRVSPGDQGPLHQQFKETVEGLPRKGTFRLVGTVDELAKAIEQCARQ